MTKMAIQSSIYYSDFCNAVCHFITAAISGGAEAVGKLTAASLCSDYVLPLDCMPNIIDLTEELPYIIDLTEELPEVPLPDWSTVIIAPANDKKNRIS